MWLQSRATYILCLNGNTPLFKSEHDPGLLQRHSKSVVFFKGTGKAMVFFKITRKDWSSSKPQEKSGLLQGHKQRVVFFKVAIKERSYSRSQDKCGPFQGHKKRVVFHRAQISMVFAQSMRSPDYEHTCNLSRYVHHIDSCIEIASINIKC